MSHFRRKVSDTIGNNLPKNMLIISKKRIMITSQRSQMVPSSEKRTTLKEIILIYEIMLLHALFAVYYNKNLIINI
jgi:hypothetical protein